MKMTRRSTIKMISGSLASLMCPTIQLRQSIPDERLLIPFCAPESFRYDFEKPFGVGSLTYATDARAMVRCELSSRVEDGERRLPKNVIGVWDYHWNPSKKWQPLTPDDVIPTETDRVTGMCPYCGDRRVSLGEHFPADQEHADELLRKLDWDVDDNTIRDESCEHCHGRDYEGPSCVRIVGVEHQAWTMRRILSLPNVHVCPGSYNRHRWGDSEPLLFKADGFEGISLGMTSR